MADEEGDSESWSVIVGIMLGLGASIGINVGNNIQSLAMGKEVDDDDFLGKKRKKKMFIGGTVLFASASIVNFVAFAFAPAAVLAPLEAIQFVSNLIFNRFVCKREITRRMVIGSCLIILGVVGAIVCGPRGGAEFTISQLIGFWAHELWLGFLGVSIGLGLVCLYVHRIHQRALDAGKPKRSYRVILPVTFAWSSATVGAQAVVQSKMMSELVSLVFSDGFSGDSIVELLKSWFFYFNLVLLLMSMVGWIYRLGMALKLYDPIFMIPLIQSFYILLSTLTGGIYFQEFIGMEPFGNPDLFGFGIGMFVLGFAVMFWGLYLLMPVGNFSEEEPALSLDAMEVAVSAEDEPAKSPGGASAADTESSPRTPRLSKRQSSLQNYQLVESTPPPMPACAAIIPGAALGRQASMATGNVGRRAYSASAAAAKTARRCSSIRMGLGMGYPPAEGAGSDNVRTMTSPARSNSHVGDDDDGPEGVTVPRAKTARMAKSLPPASVLGGKVSTQI